MSESADIENESAKATPNDIESRLAFLEEQNEGLKRSGILLVVLVVLMGATMIYTNRSSAGAVNTEGLILSSLGRPKSAITAMPTGHLGVVFYDFNGELPKEVKYKAIPYLDGFAIYDRSGNPRILMGIDDRDNPILAVVSPDGKTLFNAVTPTTAAPPAESEEEEPAATPTPQSTPE